MLRRIIAALLMVCLLTGCSGNIPPSQTKYTATFLGLFDTQTSVVGWAENEEAFTQKAQQIHDELLVYHQLFDIYHEYDGFPNLKTINDQAGIAPVAVSYEIISFLLDCKEYYSVTNQKVNVAMGSVLSLWHDSRTHGLDDPLHAELPARDDLEFAAQYVDMECILIDEAASTVYISDPNVRLDVGAVAKGWSAQRVADSAPPGLLLSVGGNVCATGGEQTWVVGINDPDGGTYLHTLNITGSYAVVTSGDYQRYYIVDGIPYHHIIDPDTLFPARYWRSVTIVCQDSGLADALSTALFLLPQDKGQALLDACDAHAMWVDSEGTEFFSPGFQNYIRT